MSFKIKHTSILLSKYKGGWMKIAYYVQNEQRIKKYIYYIDGILLKIIKYKNIHSFIIHTRLYCTGQHLCVISCFQILVL